jgi:hypothetical protein
MASADVSLTFDTNHALVLFDLLARWEGDKDAPRPSDDCFEHVAEVGALMELFQKLDAQLVGRFPEAGGPYDQMVADARDVIGSGPGVKMLGPWRNGG